jgi:TolA-binding protein
VNTEAGVEAVAYQIMKSGYHQTSIVLLEANLRDYPKSANAHFQLGRAYRAAEQEREAIEEFQAALRIDPSHKQATEALAQRRP